MGRMMKRKVRVPVARAPGVYRRLRKALGGGKRRMKKMGMMRV